ncbi:IS4 family transposase [Clostridium sp. ZS2-4]|uniref:IS4 family transposase n=1 Tax=Clostridium sp. ZS2-4 TaxID=2987703 RepID=UPI00227D03EB|nr:IS4 family transposase [Clostridium sp. ZS2-4]MCY6355003.1 IS4 family transposase [Clostridium sp. ZS2-4]
MKQKNYFSQGIKITNRLIDDILFMCETRRKETYFTRIGSNIMTFKSILIFILNFVKRSLQLELDDFFNDISGTNSYVTKQAFSKARQKILPTAFIKMSAEIIKWFYKDTDFKSYRGYRLLSIDGTVLEINNTETLRNEFGYIENQSIKVARARATGLYDVENDMIISSVINHYRTGERASAQELINKLEDLGFCNDLILFDRGYPSRDFISFIESKNIKYLMRVSGAFLKEVVNAKNEDQIIEVKYKKKIIKMRVLKFQLDSGITEILITNIFDKSFSVVDFKKLYFKRWGIEVKYNELKSRLQIENFSGETPIAIKQDFYATMYLSNMVSLAKLDANAIIQENNDDKNLKHEYKVNTNILIGKLKNSLVIMLLEKSPRKRSKILNKIMKEISRNIIPIRSDRQYERRMTVRANKNSMNTKRSL